ncbi:hypothetical protein JHK87_052268 [Glycine soja]|nr:hypothetical protein JHK87_052268 [Glycine soja]
MEYDRYVGSKIDVVYVVHEPPQCRCGVFVSMTKDNNIAIVGVMQTIIEASIRDIIIHTQRACHFVLTEISLKYMEPEEHRPYYTSSMLIYGWKAAPRTFSNQNDDEARLTQQEEQCRCVAVAHLDPLQIANPPFVGNGGAHRERAH